MAISYVIPVLVVLLVVRQGYNTNVNRPILFLGLNSHFPSDLILDLNHHLFTHLPSFIQYYSVH